ncbi:MULTISPECIES: LysR family transcriptional regulator [Achromobacter]|jgi:DNA-binding transcriptional LysR family regulator|uniref:LysR family transcriptional regulator n=1 Tax=Achromobacter denitrificans TaxID=32002 RepID=A0A3R9H2B5_ACHDE|nr:MULTISPECIES: LysR family transcriptional regulator [Achromobacter]MBV2159064.1 LysR family transcriptional regulator [Achromobacter denitrificans]MDF3851554.1 LysR family transcriptional regulator [Achromobacter denitrificans]MDF3857472.1 LysR family transcriptional regulator [Achromobacter denitrificans]MDF3943494.1 LysR family transcriptional regulator [Achromobacter denitrificans]MDX3882129.1 LysR family transcriptional regulator [Achromobacter sp.]
MQWTLDQLRQFAAAAEAGSFSAAGRRLGRAQSAISTSVGLLEADLGVELFDRSRRNATLTPAGEVMLQEARELLRQAGALEQRALAFAAGREARLSIALDEGLPYLVADQLLKELAERYPALELTQLNGTATEVAGYVEQGRASLAFQFDRGDPGSAFAHRHLGNVAQGIFVAQGHPLAALAEVGRNDLARHRQLLMQMDGVEQVVLSPSVWRADSSYNIAAMAAHGVGWAILPLNIGEYEGFSNQLVSVRCADLFLPMLSVRTLWLQGGSLSETEQWLQQRMGQLLRAGAPAPAGGPGVN